MLFREGGLLFPPLWQEDSQASSRCLARCCSWASPCRLHNRFQSRHSSPASQVSVGHACSPSVLTYQVPEVPQPQHYSSQAPPPPRLQSVECRLHPRLRCSSFRLLSSSCGPMCSHPSSVPLLALTWLFLPLFLLMAPPPRYESPTPATTVIGAPCCPRHPSQSTCRWCPCLYIGAFVCVHPDVDRLAVPQGGPVAGHAFT